MRPRLLIFAMGLLLATLLVAGCSDSDTPDPRQENVSQSPPEADQGVPADEPVAEVASQVEPSVVQVNVSGAQTTPFGSQEQSSGLGSGVIYRQDGYVITNNHVVEGASEVSVALADGSTEQGEIVGTDPLTDLAVVRVDRNDLPAASFKGDGAPTVGQLAVAIGSPSGFESTVTAGVISGLNRDLPPELTGGGEGAAALVDLVQTDAAISPGNSGGALANRSGQVMGINVAYLPPQTGAEGIGFAIPSDTAISVADQLIETGEVAKPYLGIGLADLSRQDAEQFNLPVESGALVTEVQPGTPADSAGLRAEEIITALDDTPIEDSGDLLAALRDYQPGDTVQVTVVERNGNERTVDLTLDERPQQ
ncbi:MAG: trypsin-like peptidase domain-containing protein [Rubrobacteraceae bacterium]